MTWRVGGKVPLNVYEGDKPMFQCHTPEDAARVAGLLNDVQHVWDVLRNEHRPENCDHQRRGYYCQVCEDLKKHFAGTRPLQGGHAK